ncbi:MAG: 4Fe-4S dicluster domain-containing protein [Nitrospinota bacterium]|nr:MAG: 4Fe-4S dicluster domain-containing protein [Nitrospinota bacterium]
MLVDKSRCVGCGNCVPLCPMGAISIGPDKRADINQDECVECGVCERVLRKEGLSPTPIRLIRKFLTLLHLRYMPPLDVCPTNALVKPELEWPRILRREFSDPLEKHSTTGMGGRGTEEIKTNDVTGRLQEGEVGFVVELGRPGIGARFWEIERMAMALAKLGVTFQKGNPLTYLMSDPSTGKLKEEVLNEKVLSAIIELKTTMDKIPEVLQTIQQVEKEITTVVSVGIASKCRPDGSVPHEEWVQKAGFSLSINGKTNLGFGRATNVAG